MSTEYGLKCVTCNKKILGYNLRLYVAEVIMEHLSQLAKLYTIAMQSIPNLDVEIKLMGCCNFNEILEFVYEHNDHGIELIDEYQYYKETD